jgi:hypothetical protein
MALVGADSDQFDPSLPPLLQGGRSTAGGEIMVGDAPAAGAPRPRESSSLLIETPIRSGQSIVFPGGDVTVVQLRHPLTDRKRGGENDNVAKTIQAISDGALQSHTGSPS